MRERLVKPMLSTPKVWLGLAALAAALAMAQIAACQDYGSFKSGPDRTGKTADPVHYGPGVANLTWFWPNQFGMTGAPTTSVRDNMSSYPLVPPNFGGSNVETIRLPINLLNGTGDGTAPMTDPASGWFGANYSNSSAAGFYYDVSNLYSITPSLSIDPRDVVRGYNNEDPFRTTTNTALLSDYELIDSVPSALGSYLNPTTALVPGQLASFTWTIDPTQDFYPTQAVQPTNYQLFVWIPLGPTSYTSAGGANYTVYPNRYYVYTIDYDDPINIGQRLHWIDVVDTNVSGQGWVRLGNGGYPTNMVFPYNGTGGPITIHLYNTQLRDAFDNILEDNSVQRCVYADATMAVPDNGSAPSSPVATQIGTGVNVRDQVVQCFNKDSVAYQDANQVTVVNGEVDAFLAEGTNPNGNAPLWKWSPITVSPYATMLDNTDALPNSGNWVSDNLVPHVGVDYLKNTVTNTAPPPNTPPDSVVYSPKLEDGDYLIQMYVGGNFGGETFGTQVQVWIYEGSNPPTVVDVDESVPGWVTLGTRRFQHRNAVGETLRVFLSNYSANPTDNGLLAYADAVRFIGAFNDTITSTPVQTKANIKLSNGTTALTDVVLVACEDGHLYCLDATGNGDGTTTLYWSYPSIMPAGSPVGADPNTATTADGDGNDPLHGNIITEMPTSGFGLSSPLVVQGLNGTDCCFIAADNGRVYCIDMAGRGDYNTTTGKIGTTDRVWSYPNDWPAVKVSAISGGFGGSVAYSATGVAATPTLFAPAMEGRLYALNAVGGAKHTTTLRWSYPQKTTQNLGAVTTTPAVDFGRVYFGTAILNDTAPGQFYALNADTGAYVWSFEGDPATGLADNFRGGPATATALQLGVANNMVFCSNDNLFVYGLDADTGNLLWETPELDTTVTGALMFDVMNVFDNTGTGSVEQAPILMVPTDDGRFDGLFATPGTVNKLGTRLAWEYLAGSNSIQASMANARNIMFGADMSGSLYAWSNASGVAGLGNAPGGPSFPPNSPVAAGFNDAAVVRITKAAYDNLRMNKDTTGELGTEDYNNYINATPPALPTTAYIHNRSQYEWGETAYFLVYYFPFAYQDPQSGVTFGPPKNPPPTVNFQIGVTGAAVRPYSVQCKQWFKNAPTDPNTGQAADGYAILAFPIQGAGPTSIPPGSATVRAAFTVNAGGGRLSNISYSTSVGLSILNPLGIVMPDANGGFPGLIQGALDFGTTKDWTDPERALNGSPNMPGGGTQGSLLGQTAGVVSNGQTGIGGFWLVDMSVMNLLKGGTIGLQDVRLTRPDLVWLGGGAAVYKPLDPVMYPGFEDMPVNYPNTSIDYPNISRSNVRATKDPTGTPENAIISPSGFSMLQATPLPETYTDAQLLARQLAATPIEFDVDVPRFQPANNHNMSLGADGATDPLNLYFEDSANSWLASGYQARVDAYVDSNNDSQLDYLSGRREAYRAWTTNLAVGLDERLSVTTPVVDLGPLAEGTGYSPLPPGSGSGSTFSPWSPLFSSLTALGGQVITPITSTETPYQNLFKNFAIDNLGNANDINLRLVHGTAGPAGALPGPWAIRSSSVDDLGWLDTSSYVWTNFDWTFGLMPEISLQKARVGDVVPTELSLNPNLRYNQNLGIAQTSLFPAWPVTGLTTGGLDLTQPMIAATPPIGFPVGDYSQTVTFMDDVIPFNGILFSPPYGDQFLEVDGSNDPLEPMSNPGLTLKFRVRESRLTNAATAGTVAGATVPGGNGFVDRMQAAPNQLNLEYGNSQPTALRDLNGGLLLAYTSSQLAFNAPRPALPDTDPQNEIYIATLVGKAPTNAMQSPLGELNFFKPAPGDNQWFQQEVGPYPGTGNLNNLFQVQNGDSVIAAKFTSPALPSSGLIDPLGGPNFQSATLAFIGTGDIQTGGGRETQFRLMTANVSSNASGAVTIGAPNVMPFDPDSPKSRPSVYQVQGGAVIFYASTNTGVPQFFYTVTDGTTYAQPATFSVGNGFEELNSPSVQVRPYVGILGAQPIVEFSFAGKLRGRANSEIFYGRAFTTAAAVGNNSIPDAPGLPMYLAPRYQETLTKDSEAGTYRAQGVIWNSALALNQAGFTPRTEFRVYQSLNGGPLVDLEVNGTRTVDQASGLIRFDTALGGEAYVDPSLGTVRFADTVPVSSATIVLDYQPRFIRVSEATVAGHGSPTVLWDNRIAGDISPYSYWFNVSSGGGVSNVLPGATPRPARYVFTYTQGSAGAGLAERPYWKTLRLGVQLPTAIATDKSGDIISLNIGGTAGPVQVDPADGRIFFPATDEDRAVKITYTGIDPGTLQLVTINNVYTVGIIVEKPEAPIPIDQAVNEASVAAFLDPFDMIDRPGLIWMFYTSTRAGAQDLYFQTMAPRFTPTINGK